MNKVIQDLVQEATDTVEIVNPDTGITHHREFFDKEKFAELIVRECANKIERDYKYVTGTDTKWNTAFTIVCDLKQHFGVEE